MNILIKVVGIFSIILNLLMLLCGLWLKSHPTNEPGAHTFHFQFGLASIIVSIIAVVLLFLKH